jgi:PAS domain S-box-containing protein
MKNDFHRQVLQKAPFGYAHHEIILDDAGKPYDYRFLEVNEAFEKLTGLKKENLLGRTVREAIPEIEKDKFNWISFYGRIALEGLEEEFEQYSEALKGWYRVQAFSSQKNLFTTVFDDITKYFNADNELLVYRERLETILNITGTRIDIIDEEYNLHFVDKFWQQTYGDPGGRKCYEYYMGLNEPCPECGIPRAFATREIVVTEEILPKENNRIFEVHTIPFQDASGKWLAAEFNLDITRRKLAENELKIKEKAIEVSFNAVAFSDLHGNITYVNPAFLKMWGYDTPAEVLGRPSVSFWLMEERAKEVIKASSEKGSWVGELIAKRKDGSLFTVSVSANLITDDQGKPIQKMASFVDLTERKQTEEILRKANETLESRVEQRTKELEESNRLLYETGMIARVGGWEIDLVSGKHTWSEITKLIHEVEHDFDPNLDKAINFYAPEHKPVISKLVENLIQTGEAFDEELKMITAKNNNLWVRALGKAYRSNGKIARIGGVFQDITERKLAEIELSKYHNNLEEKVRERTNSLIAITNELERKEKEAKALIAGIPDMIFRLNHSGVFLYYKGASDDLLVSPDNFLNKNVNDLLPQWFAKLTLDNINITLKTGKPQYYEYELAPPEKGTRSYECRMVPFSADEVMAIVRDVTDRKQMESEILESEEKYRTLFENLSQGVFYKDSSGRMIDVNDAALRMFGLSRDQFLGKDAYNPRWKVINENNEIIPPEKFPSMLALHSGKPVNDQVIGVYIPETGMYNWLIFDAIPQFRKGETKPYQVFASMQDITLRKKAEDHLRISEYRLSKSMLAAYEGVWDWDLTTDDVYFDPRYYLVAGYEVNEFPHRLEEFTKRVHPDDLDAVMLAADEHLKGLSERFQKEFRFRRKDGEYMWILGHGIIAERDKNGTPTRFIGTQKDISELKRMRLLDECRLRLLLFSDNHILEELLEETLNEAEILTESKIGFYHFIEDDQTTIHLKCWSTQTKTAYCRTEGFEMKYNLKNAGVWTDCVKERKTIVHNDYNALPNRKGLPAGHAEVIRELVVPVFRGTKIKAILGVGNKPVPYNKQDIEAIEKLAELAWDIAERKLMNDALAESRKNLQELNAQKDKFFSIIAHDLKSPFNSILGFSDLLVEQTKANDHDGIEQYAQFILQSSKRAMDLLLNLLEWSQSQTGMIHYKPEEFELVDFVNKTITIFEDIGLPKSISISKELPRNLSVFADKHMLGTIMRNLISNAIKFTHEGGRIVISAEIQPDDIVISVGDNGVGIAKNRIKRLFRIDENESTPGTANEQGTGLGLILCKEFVEKHGGRIWVESKVNMGTTFKFSIPLKPEL